MSKRVSAERFDDGLRNDILSPQELPNLLKRAQLYGCSGWFDSRPLIINSMTLSSCHLFLLL